jgi:hypothetical protein
MDIAPHLDELGYCPFAMLTGKPCILCGGSRAVQALAKGHVYEAYQFNVSVLLLVFVLGLFVAKRGYLLYKSKDFRIIYPGHLVNELGDLIRHRYRLAIFLGLLWWLWNIQRW